VSINLDLNESEYVETINFGRFTGSLSEENNLHIGDYFYVDWVKAYVPMNVENGNITQSLDSSEYNDVFMFEFVSNSSEFDYFTNILGDTCDFEEGDIEEWNNTWHNSYTVQDGYARFYSDGSYSTTPIIRKLYNWLNSNYTPFYNYLIIKARCSSNATGNRLKFYLYNSSDYLLKTDVIDYLSTDWKIYTIDLSKIPAWLEAKKLDFRLADNPVLNAYVDIDYIKIVKRNYSLQSLSNGDLNVTLSDDSNHSQLINQEILDNHLNYTWGNSSHYETISQFAIGKYLFYTKYGFYPTKITITMSVGENSNTRIYNKYVYTFIPNYNIFFDYSDSKGDNKKYDLDISDLYYLDNLGNKTEYQKYKHQFISFKTYSSSILFTLSSFFSLSHIEKGYFSLYFSEPQETLKIYFGYSGGYAINWSFINNGSLLINNQADSSRNFVLRINKLDTWLTLEQISFGQVYMFKHSLLGQTTFAGKYFTNITVGDYSQWHNVPLINNSISGFHDYAQEVLGDAWDFEEGDTEIFTGLINQKVEKGIFFGNTTSSSANDYFAIDQQEYIDNYYNKLIIKLKTNINNLRFRVFFYHLDGTQTISEFYNVSLSFKTFIINKIDNLAINKFSINFNNLTGNNLDGNCQIQIDFRRLTFLS
ncbi:MAG: hypothetical protein ACTSPQ_22650, partial [Candidatus Helarchaeota archaeon]